MANPFPYFFTGSSITFRLTMATLQKLTVAATVLVRRIKLMMGTATGIALTYGVYKTVLGGEPYLRRAQNECTPKVCKVVENPPFEKVELDIERIEDPSRHGLQERPPPAVYLDLAASARSQPCVTAHDKAHSLFLWIGVKEEADPRVVACRAARIPEMVKQVEEPNDEACGNYRVMAGVGFGPEFYKIVRGNVPQPFSNAKHSLISAKSVGGDILIHAKANDLETLKELSKTVLNSFPEDSILWHEETYGQHSDPDSINQHVNEDEGVNVLNYQYTKGEMELFPPKLPVHRTKPNILFVTDTGTDDTIPKRSEIAADPKTGGSYVMTQKWVHDETLLDRKGEDVMNEWVDKAWEVCAGPPGERKFKAHTIPHQPFGAEIARESMEKWLNTAYQECLAIQQKHPNRQIICTPGNPGLVPFRILRQSLPFKSQSGDVGLFFICYASTPQYNEMLLDQLVASACGGGRLNKACRNVFRLSQNVRSACWYFPGVQELREMT